MAGQPFDLGAGDLPAVLPIFPLTGVLLLPRGRLPLNIFEPRYLAMVSDAMAAPRLIGMVQPQEGAGDAAEPPVYRTACAGRITSFSENEDGRYLISLVGVARFTIAEELPLVRGYRPVRADWSRFLGDIEADGEARFDRKRLLTALRPFLHRNKIEVDWEMVAKTPDQRLITTLAMVCPFAPREKQALLEAADLPARAQLLTALLEMAEMQVSAERAALRH